MPTNLQRHALHCKCLTSENYSRQQAKSNPSHEARIRAFLADAETIAEQIRLAKFTRDAFMFSSATNWSTLNNAFSLRRPYARKRHGLGNDPKYLLDTKHATPSVLLAQRSLNACLPFNERFHRPFLCMQCKLKHSGCVT